MQHFVSAHDASQSATTVSPTGSRASSGCPAWCRGSRISVDVVTEGHAFEAFVHAFIARSQELGVTGANPNPMFNTMMTIAKLRELGLVAKGAGSKQTWTRPVLDDSTRAP